MKTVDNFDYPHIFMQKKNVANVPNSLWNASHQKFTHLMDLFYSMETHDRQTLSHKTNAGRGNFHRLVTRFRKPPCERNFSKCFCARFR